ncbi:hypothetical protein [Victivallis lenta]|uniref:hypothetical protein n=1 Tax=Victivallis lenta TaxID=2606640 RepID=UPI003AB5761B
MKHNCENCRWFESNDLGDKSGECRRHAPLPANLNRPEPDEDSDEGFYAVWPEVHEGLRCGEFEAK